MAHGGRLRVEVLGPVRVLDNDGRDLTPDGALQRRLLALLVLRRGHTVSVDLAIEALWGTGAPRNPVAALHNQISRLRRRLPGGLIESIGEGYLLDPSLVDVDADRLADQLSTGAADLDTLDATLARWHGPAFPELVEVDDGRAEAVRLEELRSRARETRAEQWVAVGQLDRALAELAAMADDEPLRERPRALLMTALARAGRTADALRVYDDFRRRLGDELGIEPSPSLQAQHADLLAGVEAVAPAPVSRVPVPVTSLIGRDRLAEEVLATVETTRLLTLIGPGGVGKTRMLVEVGTRLRADNPRRPVVMCELAAASEESAVDVVAAALAIEGRPGVGLAERVVAVLADAEVVLLLDNCEHVLDPVAALVERLLASCPHVGVVATSRERLRVAAEHVCTVPVLESASAESDAVRLFVERGRAVVPGFEPDAGDLAAIVEIVGRLDGVPLAIELAAARLHTLDVSEIADGLDHRFELLSSGYRTSARHGSLRAALSWSFDLLDETQQRTLAVLSVFAGPFSVADAAAIGGTDRAAAATTLDQLTERSLVTRAPDRRYVLLETVRAFGAERAAAIGGHERAATRHAHHYVDWAERADQEMHDPARLILPEIDDALPELRAALAWLLERDEVERAGRLVGALLDYGLFRLRPDVLAWAMRVIAADPDHTSAAAPDVLAAAAYERWMAGDLDGHGEWAERAVAVTERQRLPLSPKVAAAVGNQALFEGRLDDATTWYGRCREAAAGDASQTLLIRCTSLLAPAYASDPTAEATAAELIADTGDALTPHAAYAWYCAGEVDLAFDLDRARVRFAKAIELAEATRATFVTGIAGSSKASLDARVGDPLAAADDYRSLLSHWRKAGMWSTQWTMLRSVCGLLARLERFRDAAVLEGAIRHTTAGHRIFGADETALAELSQRLRAELGDETYDAARAEGTVLDGDAAVEHALRCL